MAMVRQSKENADPDQDQDQISLNEGVIVILEGTETIPGTENDIEIEAPSVIVSAATTTVSEEEEEDDEADEADEEEEEEATTITNHTRTSSLDGSYYTDHTRTSSSDGSYYFQSIKSNESLCYSATGSSGSSLTSLLYGTGINILPNNNNKPASSSYLSHLLPGTGLGGQQRIPSSLFPKLATDATATKKQQQQQQFSRPQSMLQQPGEGTQSSGTNTHHISTLPLHPRSVSLSSTSSTASPGRHVFPSYYYKYQHPDHPDQQQIKSKNVYQQRIPYQQQHSIDSECEDSMSTGSSSSYKRSSRNKNALRCLLSPRVLVTIFICGVIIDNLLNSGAKKAHQQLHRIGNRKYHSCSDGSSVMGGDTGLPNCYDDDNTININGEGDGDDTLQDSWWLWNHHRRTLLVDDSENNAPLTRTEKEMEEEVVAVVDSVVPSSMMIPPVRANKTVPTTMAAFSENRKRKPLLRSF